MHNKKAARADLAAGGGEGVLRGETKRFTANFSPPFVQSKTSFHITPCFFHSPIRLACFLCLSYFNYTALYGRHIYGI